MIGLAVFLGFMVGWEMSCRPMNSTHPIYYDCLLALNQLLLFQLKTSPSHRLLKFTAPKLCLFPLSLPHPTIPYYLSACDLIPFPFAGQAHSHITAIRFVGLNQILLGPPPAHLPRYYFTKLSFFGSPLTHCCLRRVVFCTLLTSAL